MTKEVKARKPTFQTQTTGQLMVEVDAKKTAEAHRKAKLRELIDEQGSGGAAALARKAGRSQAGISHMASPGYDFGRRAARSLEDALVLPVGYFDLGATSETKQVEVRKIPLQDWSRIGRFPATEGDTVPCPWQVGPRAVAGKAKPSMWSGDGTPGVPPGWTCIIDPDVDPKEGDVVCVWPPGATEATLRQYVSDAGVRLLYPMDRRLPIVEWTQLTIVVGPVVGALMHFRN